MGNLIEELYVLPEYQGKGYGTELLRFAITQCAGTPHLLDTGKEHVGVERLDRRNGFLPTGKRNAVTNRLDVIVFSKE